MLPLARACLSNGHTRGGLQACHAAICTAHEGRELAAASSKTCMTRVQEPPAQATRPVLLLSASRKKHALLLQASPLCSRCTRSLTNSQKVQVPAWSCLLCQVLRHSLSGSTPRET